MKIVIVGAGAIGLLIGNFLSKGGHQVTFVEVREDIIAALNNQGIGFMDTGAEGQNSVVYTKTKAVRYAADIQECDLVILAVKSFDTFAAIKSVAHLVTKNSPVLSIQTGLGNLETIEKVERRNNILGGFTYMGGAGLGPGVVRLGGLGKTFLGELNGRGSQRAEEICKIFNECDIRTELADHIIRRLWCKIVVYSAINPVTGIMRIKNGQLLDKMESITLAKRLIDEGQQVAEACGISMADFKLYDLFFEACHQTSENISSMLLDLISGRRTEIDALNGTIARLGQEKGVPVETHQTLVDLIKLSEKWGPGFQQPA